MTDPLGTVRRLPSTLLRAVAGALGDLSDLRGSHVAFLGLGSNVGDRLTFLQDAVDAVHADPVSRVDAVSSVYETAPVGGVEQDSFYNCAARVVTRRSPRRLLVLAQAVEHAGLRVRTVRWGPRTIDVDLLLYADRVVELPGLTVPHPRLVERAFALVPLMEVAPGQRLPDGTSLATAVSRLAPVEGVRAIGSQVHVPGVAS